MSTLTRLDLEFYEQVVIYNILTDETYLASIIDNLEDKYFSDENIKSVIGIIKEFYNTRDAIPTITEVKAYLTSEEAKTKFRRVVELIQNFDNNFNKDELYENTERFLKEKAVVNTLLAVSYTHLRAHET